MPTSGTTSSPGRCGYRLGVRLERAPGRTSGGCEGGAALRDVRVAFLPFAAAAMVLLGVLAVISRQPPGIAIGTGFLGAAAATAQIWREATRRQGEPTPREHLRSVGWALLALVLMIGGLLLGRCLDGR